MDNKIKRYVDDLFKNAPETRKSYELKEEMLSNINDKYNDLLDMGLDEAEAYSRAVDNLSDINGLIQDVRDYTKEEEDYRKKSSIRTTIATMLYIMCPIPLLLFAESTEKFQILGVVLLLTIVAIATGIFIYNNHDKPLSRINDELYEEFIQWKDKGSKKTPMEHRIRSIVGSLTLIVYFIVSFTYDNWDVSWIIFLVGVLVKNIVSAWFEHLEIKKSKV